jgi:flagellar biosynthetic protein FlhB
MLEMGMKMVKYAMLPMLVIAIADLWYTRWDYEENLKMTKDEVKDERKQAEGDPAVKAQQRQKMMEVMAQRMLENVPKADVVVTNPTHYAVALRYDAVEAPAPVVLAKGVDHLAERIKEVAREHRVPIRENVPLARALYRQVEVGDMIPEELYQAVASLLASLMKFKARPQGR